MEGDCKIKDIYAIGNAFRLEDISYFCRMTSDEKFMHRCIQLAKNGLGTTYPNPLVGSIVVHEDKIIGEGWHLQAGMPHAEVNAIGSVENPSLLKDATIYVSLEPCSHYGKTPPCSDLIIRSGIKRVVVGITDPNPKVAGSGIQRLKDAGCKVIQGVLEDECAELNKRFLTFQTEKRPYIILKWAQSSDGYLAPAQRDNKNPVWITNTYSRQLAHKMRAHEQAILVGTQTVLDDDPSLTTRLWEGTSPTRVVLDKSLRIPEGSKIFNEDAPTLILNESKSGQQGHLFYENMDFSKNTVQQICSVLFKHNLQSVIVEGGSKTLQTFIDAGIWDEAWLFEGPVCFEKGTLAPVFKSKSIFKKDILGNDLLTIYKNLSL